MNFDDIKDQLKERLQTFWARLQESSAFNQLSERFNNLSPRAQKAALAGIAFVLSLLLLSFPYMYFSSSQDHVAEFEEKKQLIRDLFRVSREASILQNAPPTAQASQLRSSAEAQINMAQLQPDQVKSISEFVDAPKTDSQIPKSVIQNGVQVSLAKLNLHQLVELGYQLQSIHPSAKMVGLEVTANMDDPHYFDVIYRVVSFSLPPPPAPPERKNSKGAGKHPSRPARNEGE